MTVLFLERFQALQPIVDPATGRPTKYFLTLMQENAFQTEFIVNAKEDIDAAIAVADAAATTAIAAAATANAAADDVTLASNLANSGTSGLTITATDAGANVTIAISAHSRIYGDGTTVAVTGGNLTGLAYSTTYYVYYDQASRAGGAVTYVASIDPDDILQINDTHSLGGVTTPAALGSPVDGETWRGPGGVYL